MCYYLIGLPLALWLAFGKDKGVYGLWLGFSIACIVLDTGFLMIIECPNWNAIAEKVSKQIDKDKATNVHNSTKIGQRLAETDYAGKSATNEAAKHYQRDLAITRSA